MAKRSGSDKSTKRGRPVGSVTKGRRPRASKDERRISISFSSVPSFLKEIDHEVEQLGITRSSFIEQAVRRAIQERRQQEIVLSDASARDALIRFMATPGVLSVLAKAMGGESESDDVEGQQFMRFIEQQAEAFKTARGDGDEDQ
jgi:hypothetical protein